MKAVASVVQKIILRNTLQEIIMTLGIMQPYFMPYIGYWQLMTKRKFNRIVI